ncbi:MAG: sulfite oxidase [bacterium]|nr:sulfite oxidase [bacterium]
MVGDGEKDLGSWSEQSERLWELASDNGMPRRHFLALLIAGGAAAVVAACGGGGSSSVPVTGSAVSTIDPAALFKDPTPFIQRGASLESRLELMPGLITPNDLFFVRNNSTSVDLSVDDWSLVVEGDAVRQRLDLSFDDIRRLPSRSLVAFLECAGNHRVMFDRLQGRAADGTQWGRGAVGNGEWLGVSLADVLTLADLADDAVSVLLVGLDEDSPEGGFQRVLPLEKALDPDTILAYGMNGEPLPRDHGFPLRAIVPGWVGSSQIKWLGRIVVSADPQWTRNNTTSYVLIGDDYSPEGEALGQVVTEQNIKSALALPWPARLDSGQHVVGGFAHSPHGRIHRVQWSEDGGASWRDSRVLDPQPQYSWAQFEFEWTATEGEHTIMTRATDAAGNTQPDRVPFNQKGYLFNQPLPHPIRVTA